MAPTTPAGQRNQQMDAPPVVKLTRLPEAFDGFVDGQMRAMLGDRRVRIGLLRAYNLESTYPVLVPEHLLTAHEDAADDIVLLASALSGPRRSALAMVHHERELLWARNIALFRKLPAAAMNAMADSGYLSDEAVLSLEILPLAAVSGGAMRWAVQRRVVSQLAAALAHMEHAVPGTRLTLVNGDSPTDGWIETQYGISPPAVA